MTDKSQHTEGEDSLFRRFKTSVISYGLRQIIVTGLVLLTNIILTHYLLPGQFGQVAVITIVITLATLLADGGLGVYLIQRHAEVTEHDLSRVTTIQLSLASAITILSCIGAAFARYIAADATVGYMIAVASFSLPFQVIRGMALLMLERSLRINKVVHVELLEQVTYMSVAILLASFGAGAWSVVIALICKSLTGALTAKVVGGFRFKTVKPAWDNELKEGLRFGLHYQASSLITMARISIIPLYIVPMFGYDAAGFIERALYFASAPLGILLAIQNRTMFPYVSRIQHDLGKVRLFTEDAIYISAIIDKIMFLPVLLFAKPLVVIIFNSSWLPMLPLMYWVLAGNVIFGAFAGSLYPVANGIGKPEYVFRLNLVGLILSWLLTIPLTLAFGISGVGIAALIMWSGIIWLKVKITERIGPFRYFRQGLMPLFAFAISGLGIVSLLTLIPSDIRTVSHLFQWSFMCITIYLCLVGLLDHRRLRTVYQTIKNDGYTPFRT